MNISKATERYIIEHPSIKACIKKKLINYSSLSRKICEHYNIDNFDAVLIACRRYFEKTHKKDHHEDAIKKLVKGVKLRVRNKIVVAIIDKPKYLDKFFTMQKKIKKDKGDFNLIEGEDVVTIITNDTYIEEIKELFKSNLIKINQNLVQVTMIFDEKIETTSGTVAYIYNLLAEKGINILEEMSCWTDLMIVIDENDLAKAMKILSF